MVNLERLQNLSRFARLCERTGVPMSHNEGALRIEQRIQRLPKSQRTELRLRFEIEPLGKGWGEDLIAACENLGWHRSS